MSKLQAKKGWLTNDVLSLVGMKFGIRQNTPQPVQDLVQRRTDDHPVLHGVQLQFQWPIATCELLKWIVLPKYNELQAWIQDFESSSQQRLTAPLSIRRDLKVSSRQVTPVVPGPIKHGPSSQKLTSAGARTHFCQSGSTFRRRALTTLDEDEQVEFEEVQFYSFFSRSFYRNHNYVLLTTVTQLLSWPIILPNSVVWTWSDSMLQKVQGYLCSLKTWVLIATSLNTLWSMIVRLDERHAYNFVRFTFHHKPRDYRDRVLACVILAIVKFLLFYLRVVKDDEGLLALEVLKTFTQKLGDMTRIVIGAKSSAPQRRQDASSCSAQREYERLALEQALDAPIRATSLIRNRLSMEVVKNGRTYIRPSCYLDFGVMLKSGRIETRVDFNDIFRLAQTRSTGSASTSRDGGQHIAPHSEPFKGE
ncbi:hypothetical protein PINS_up009259 [Pythium insidiosum]|nr:hypothetical protein PINS_up009259 [Pythium insidiosum]